MILLKGGKKKMIICDTCKKDVTPGKNKYDIEEDDEGWIEYRMVKLDHGTRKCFCDDCLHTLIEFACSEEHLQKTIEYQKQQKEEMEHWDEENKEADSNPDEEGPIDKKISDKGFFSNLRIRPNKHLRGGRGLN